MSGIWMTYGHLSSYASHFAYLCHSMSWTSWRGYYNHHHGHATHGDICGYWIESDYYLGSMSVSIPILCSRGWV